MTARDTTYPFMAQLKQVFEYRNNFREETIYASDMFDGVFNANGYEFVAYHFLNSIYKKNGIFYRFDVEFIDSTYDDKRIQSLRMIYDNNLNQVDDNYDSIDDILLSDISDDDE